MFSKKTRLAASIALVVLGASPALHAESAPSYILNLKVDGKAKVQEWVTVNHTYTPWVNSGAPGDCTSWQANPATIDWGVTFQQSRTCSQNQVRTATPLLFNPVLQTTKNGEPFQETRSITVAQFQPAVGERDFETGELAKDWSDWRDSGQPYGCDSWSPERDTVNLYDTFDQSRSCSQNQTRERAVVMTWASGLETPLRNESDAQVVSVTQIQAAQGLKNYISGTRNDNWGAWADAGAPYNCTEWSPLPATVNLDQDFEQHRSCSQDQIAYRDVFNVWRNGDETLLRTEDRVQTLTVTQTQDAVGSKDYIKSTRTTDWSAWVADGARFNCTVWTPAENTVDLTTAFTQTRSCDQKEVRYRDVYDQWQSGTETHNRMETDRQTVSVEESQGAVGSKDFITGQRAENWPAWINSGNPYDCGVWSPATNTVNLYDDFEQSRSCSQAQTRQRKVFDVWKSGAETLSHNETGSNVISITQTQDAVGSKDYVTGTDYGNWTAWSNTNAPYSCSAWTPTPGTVNLGTTFEQSRTCSQAQSRSRVIYDVYRSGNKVNVGTDTGSQVITVTQTQNATGTKDYITGTRTGDWSAWANNGAATGCNAWTPTPDTVNLDQSFEQSRSCSQPQSRSRTIYNVWKSGAETVKNTESGAQSITVTQTQTATGSKDYIAGTRVASWSAWSNTGSEYGCGTWSPSTSTYDLGVNFTQTRSCSQDQTRTQVTYNVWKSGAETVKSTATGSQTVSVPKSKSATGTRDYNTGEKAYGNWSAWSNSGSAYSCGTWSPDPSTVNLDTAFNQTRSCSQNQTRTRTVYDVWASGNVASGTETGTQTVTVSQTNPSVGTKDYITTTRVASWSSWSNSGTPYSCSAWSPAVSTVNYGTTFNQSRSCSQDQIRTQVTYNVWKSGAETVKSTATGNQTISVSQSQSATGTKAYDTGANAYGAWSSWTNSGSQSCTGWTPSTGSYNLGTSFTQSRTCTQGQTRSRTTYDVWEPTGNVASGTETESQTVTDPQTRTATGTQDYITGTRTGSWGNWWNTGGQFGCGGWTPATSAVNYGTSFTQTQSCSQTQQQDRTVYNVWASGNETVNKTESQWRNVTVSNTKSATGTKAYDTGTDAYGSWSGWANGGAAYGCGGWTPACSGYNIGTTFTQTRSCSQYQSRSRSVYDVWNPTGNVFKTTETQEQTVTVTQSQSADGCKNYVTGSESTTGAWVANGSPSCGSWSPATSTVSSGTSFTQTRSCSQAYRQTVSSYNVWADGSKTLVNTSYNNKTETYTQSQTATGTKPVNYIWFDMGAACGTSWSGDYWDFVNASCSASQAGQTKVVTDWEPCPGGGGKKMVYTLKCIAW